MTQPTLLEYRVLEIVQRVIARQPIEDSLVELKSQWIEPKEAARRIAGHANAAHGEPILWLIGIDGKAHTVVGTNQNDLAQWWPQVRTHFSELAPDLQDLNIPFDGKTVVALVFTTNRAPYVVKNPVAGNPGSGPVTLEVPWREGTSVRSANRSDLIRILVPQLLLPTVNVLKGTLHAYETDAYQKSHGTYGWSLNLDIYIGTESDHRIVIPFHKCEITVIITDNYKMPDPESPLIVSTSNEVIITGPGKVFLRAAGYSDTLPSSERDIDIVLRFQPHNSDLPVIKPLTLNSDPTDDPKKLHWNYKP